jgi:chemosensory pili system protein ChpA (sensor histidine kinase/response regulator)
MDARDNASTDDLSALAWVQDELRKSLETAHKALHRFVKESEALSGSDVDAVDPGVLRGARQQLHQGAGALELVGLVAGAQLLRASETAVQRLSAKAKKLDAAAVAAIERASFALLDYLSRRLAGKQVSTLALFPAYRAVQQLAGAERVHPADLWSQDWQWRDLSVATARGARQADASARAEFEGLMLQLMRQPERAVAVRARDLFAGLAAGAPTAQLRTLWQLAAAFFDGQAQELPPPDIYTKRVGSRLMAQLKICERGETEVSDRLAQDLLFFCAQAGTEGDSGGTPLLAGVRRAYGLRGIAAVNYEDPRLGRFDPTVIQQARKRVAGAKDGWSAVAGGELHRLQGLPEQFALVNDSIKRLFPSGEALADALQSAVQQTTASAQAPGAELAMEVATAVLYLDAALEDGEFDRADESQRVLRLAERIGRVRQGSASEPLEPWMEELYRRVSDRQTMGSVVQELRASLSEVEKQIDQYFRNPAARELLIPVPGQLSAMRGVLSVLGLDHASQAVVRMRDEVDTLAATQVDPQRATQAGTFDRLAGNLGALGFLIDMVSVQPQLAKSLFAFDANSGTLRAVMGQEARRSADVAADSAEAMPTLDLLDHARDVALAAVHPEVTVEQVVLDLERLSEQALVADQPTLAEAVNTAHAALEHADSEAERQAVREEVAMAIADFVATASGADTLDPLPATAPAPAPAAAPVVPGSTGLEDDEEMREIFLEEAREVMQGAEEALSALLDEPADIGHLTTLRRAFHTLKGSSRMVGLVEFGEAGWACEQLYNTRLADSPAADEDLQAFTRDALAYLSDWVDAIASRESRGHHAEAVRAAADALRNEHRRLPLPLPGAAGDLSLHVPDLPSASDLELPSLDAVDQAAPVEPELPAAETTAVLNVLDFEPAASEPIPETPIATEVIELDLESLPELVEATALAEPAVIELPATPADEVPVTLDLSLPDAAAEAEGAAPELPQDTAEALPAFDLSALEFAEEPVEVPEVVEPAALAEVTEKAEVAELAEPRAPVEPEVDLDQVKVVGPLRISIPLFNIYLNEADELSRRLCTEVAEWSLELHRPVGETAVAMAHSLAGNSATVGFADLSQLARALEHALMRSQAIGRGDAEEAQLFADAAEEIRRLLHQFAAGFLKDVPPELMARLSAHEITSGARLQALSEAPADADEAEAPVAAEPASEPQPLLQAEAQPEAEPEAQSAPQPEAIPEPSLATELGLPEIKALTALPDAERRTVAAPSEALDDEDDIDAVDAIDAELFPIFEEEGQELLPQLASQMRDWSRRPEEAGAAAACMRTLHTLKGGARLAGAMRLGEMAHRLETAIEHLLGRGDAGAADVEALEGRVDALQARFDALRSNDAAAYAQAEAAVEEALRAAPALPLPVAAPEVSPLAEAPSAPTEEAAPVAEPAKAAPQRPSTAAPIDWGRFQDVSPAAPKAAAGQRATLPAASHASVRVRAPLLDRLVNHAGEVSITRSRIESDVAQLKSSLTDLTDNLERLRHQLRDIELQAETQIASRIEAAKAMSQEFDPLEFDRFTRFQELTRMMAESVNDVATVQRSLQRTLQSTEDELAAQARLTRDLQDDLLRTRMVEFEGLSERLYRVVRQAAKETGKQVRLDIIGGSIEVDRGVLDRMTGAFEHLLRNCVTHGIESPERRAAAGKDAAGQITVVLSQEGNEVGVEFRDDGAGLNLARIRERGLAMGLLKPESQTSDGELASLIFTPGFSTAETVTELAGRGVGMDVVRNEVNAMGGRIETATAAGQGTSFKLVLPLTTAVTQVVMVRCGESTVAIPSTLVEIVQRAKPAAVEQAYTSGHYAVGDRSLPFFWLGALLQSSARGTETGRTLPVIIVRSAQQRVALHVDEVLGNQEVVVKNLGNQLSRLPGLAGMTLLASGAVALIYNPVALATLYGEAAWNAMREAALRAQQGAVQAQVQEPAVVLAPLVLVVDDSLTVRRVTQRLLAREGYRVALAKDGLEGLERLAEERPTVVLSDIEMPRMDGFDLVRNMRGDQRWRDLPVIMITSRIAQKHRDYAAELGVDHYLGKPYSEEDLLALVSRYAGAVAPA